MTIHPIFDTPSGAPQEGYAGHSASCHCDSCLGLEHPDSVLTDLVVAEAAEWYQDSVLGETDQSLIDRLKAVGDPEITWDHEIALYEHYWTHPNYRGQPTDNPLSYWFFDVYRIKPKYRDASYKPALIRVVIGRMGNTTHIDVRHPTE